MNFSLTDLQVFWAVGALERLCTLGLLQQPPLQVSPEAIDLFVKLDEHRDKLFLDDEYLKQLVTTIIKSESPETPENDVKHIANFVCEYKNERTQLVKDVMKLNTQE